MTATMPVPLLVTRLLEHGCRRAAAEELVTLGADGMHRQTYAQLRARACALAHALRALDIAPGDRVATLMSNGHRHLEAFYAVPAMGAVLHTLNLRLMPAEIEYIVNHAEDRVLLVDAELLPLIAGHLSRMPTLRHIVVAAPSGAQAFREKLPAALDWEKLVAGQPDHYPWPELDEYAPMGLCYTSGTTGNPKGVAYSHRSTYLHTMAQAMTDGVGLSATDCVLQVVPMFHVLGWGYPYTATMLGAKQVLLHGSLRPEAILDAIETEQVTFSAAVPTVWQEVQSTLQRFPGRWTLREFKRINCGASAPSASLIRWYWDELGVEMIQTWGMTETNPLGVTSRRVAKRAHRTLSADEQNRNVAKTGLPLPGIDLEIVDDDGKILPHDGTTPGNLLIRGPWVCAEYYRHPAPDKFQGGWLHTGDIAKIDGEGYLIISDRAKDLIKSGGEWISSIDLENHILAMRGVKWAAVVAQPHPKWGERPVALVVREDGSEVTAQSVVAHCAARFARWQLPDDVLFIAVMPLNSTGKLDKKAIHAKLREDAYVLPALRANAAPDA